MTSIIHLTILELTFYSIPLQEEIVKLKKCRESLESSIREKERNEHVSIREITKLRQEVSRYIRNTSRESANLEYLKNIVLRFLFYCLTIYNLFQYDNIICCHIMISFSGICELRAVQKRNKFCWQSLLFYNLVKVNDNQSNINLYRDGFPNFYLISFNLKIWDRYLIFAWCIWIKLVVN